MTVRKITEAEYKRTLEVFAIAFEAGKHQDAGSAEDVERLRQHPRNREERFWLERWAAFNADNDMMGFLIGFPAPVRFDGHEVQCTCIGGVSSLPQYRGHGVIAGCFRQHLADSYASGAVFSYLYPFSTVFYRQFGYELCAETVEWSFEISAIPAFPEAQGTAFLNEGRSEYDAIRQVYAQSMAAYNLSFIREDCDWQRVISDTPAVDSRYTYVWKNRAGEPKGLFTFRKEYDERCAQSVMVCTDFHYTDDEGLKGLLNFIRSFRSHYQRVRIPLPKDAALERVLPEVSGHCARELRFTGMGRIINVQRALELARYRGSGQVALKVSDPLVPQNNGVFRITFENGACTAVEPGDGYDAEVGIGTLTRLLIGNCGLDDAQPPLNQVFYAKKQFICDFF